MADALTIAGDVVPFDLYGLRGDLAPRTFAGVGRHGETIELVALEHGDRWRPPHTCVRVAVVGPLHRVTEHGRSSIDPMRMIVSELLSAADASFDTGEELMRGVDDVIARGWSTTELEVDGRRERFDVMRDGEHWAATHPLEPDHLLYVVASNVAPANVSLERLRDLSAYSRA